MYIHKKGHSLRKRNLKAARQKLFLEKLIKARPIKMVTSFLAHWNGHRCLFSSGPKELKREVLTQIGRCKKENKGFGIYENSGFEKYYP